MITFLFWNMNRKGLEGPLGILAKAHRIDVIILAECPSSPTIVLKVLNSVSPGFHFPWSLCERIKVFTRFKSRFLRADREDERVSIRQLRLPGRQEILIAMAHLPSKLHFDDDSQIFGCIDFADAIREQENKAGHTRTLVVGDLNVNPFETGIVGTHGFHAVMTKALATRRSRIVQGKKFDFFYNPMWGYFGDRFEGPGGTCYYDRAEHANFFWNVFDQILLRPDLLDGFPQRELKILTDIDGMPLLNKMGTPDPKVGSDHLPIMFQLNF